jgi:hypothetical protein
VLRSARAALVYVAWAVKGLPFGPAAAVLPTSLLIGPANFKYESVDIAPVSAQILCLPARLSTGIANC